MPFIVQDANGNTTSCCLRPPEPTDEVWIEVLDNDPRCAVVLPPLPAQPSLADQILSNPIELAKLKTALGIA